MNTSPQTRQGFALLVTIIFISVILALGASLLDVAFKQILLSSSAKQSQYAFYNADSALECALYFDQKLNAFSYASPLPISSVVCDTRAVVRQPPAPPADVSGSTRTTTFTVPCAGSGNSATVTVLKQSSGVTEIYANGYNTCDTSLTTRIERGLKIRY